ncbi:MAG: cell division protein ZapE, partial [Burkholderiales bacterium]
MSHEWLTPLQRYQKDLECRGFTSDPAQLYAVAYTQALYDALAGENRRRKDLFVRLRRSVLGRRGVNFKGIYFWGGVGRGKTWLADAFYDCLPFERKLRMHFHRFMWRAHRELKELKHVEDPLQVVAQRMSERTRVLCFDEFHVSDITDAMLLGTLLGALFERGVCLIATSNEHPDRLYHAGLQRERFLPAIELIKANTHVVNLDSGVDYRMRYLDRAEIYHCPLDAGAEAVLRTHFEHIAPDAGVRDGPILIEGREIATVQVADGVVWFDFPRICGGPRAPADYIEIARLYQTVLISNVPQLGDAGLDSAQRFIHLVDEFY